MTSPLAAARRLAGAGPALRAIPTDRLLAAWNDTVAAFLDADSPERRKLDFDLCRSTRLSPTGLDHGLRTISAGMIGEAAAAELRRTHRQQEDGFSLVVLPAEPPGLMLQSLLPALAARSPVLFKSSRAEPHFAPAFLGALARRLPALREAYAAAVWTGGDATIEPALHAAARVVVAYGGEEAIEALQAAAGAEADRRHVAERRRRQADRVGAETAAAHRLIAFGPRLSLGWVGPDADPELERAARGMALDVATFDQRGCLSVHAVLVEPAIAPAFAGALASALRELAEELPPGPAAAADRAGVRLVREDADLRGLAWHGGALDAGTVILENDTRTGPSPGLRTVRVHPTTETPPLRDWGGRLQGVAVAGRMPARLRRAFEQAGVSRFAPAGQLQATNAAWRNGGIDLAAEFAGADSRELKLQRSLDRAHERYGDAFRRLAE